MVRRREGYVPPETGFGGQLRAIREKKGLTQVELAERCNVRVMTISDLERDAKLPGWDLVLLLAEKLGVKVGAFVPKPPAPPKPRD